MSDVYLIWSNEHIMWWGPDDRGYVKSFAQAGQYSRDEAVSICASAIAGTAKKIGRLPELPVLLEDVLRMQALYSDEYSPRRQEFWE